MKYILFLIIPLILFSQIHYAKMEPFDSINIKSAVSGSVLNVALQSEGTEVKNARIIHIDDTLDKINLKNSKKSLHLLDEMLKINKEVAQSLKDSMERSRSYYERIRILSTVSKTQKDNAYNNYASAKTQYFTTKEKIVNLQKQVLDISYKIAQLEESIKKKSVYLKDKYLYTLLVRKGDFVAPGTPLAKIKDISKAKLVLFLDPEEIKDIEHKSIYIDDKKTEYKIGKIWKIADEKYISSYRAEIYLPNERNRFSQLVKVEIK